MANVRRQGGPASRYLKMRDYRDAILSFEQTGSLEAMKTAWLRQDGGRLASAYDDHFMMSARQFELDDGAGNVKGSRRRPTPLLNDIHLDAIELDEVDFGAGNTRRAGRLNLFSDEPAEMDYAAPAAKSDRSLSDAQALLDEVSEGLPKKPTPAELLRVKKEVLRQMQDDIDTVHGRLDKLAAIPTTAENAVIKRQILMVMDKKRKQVIEGLAKSEREWKAAAKKTGGHDARVLNAVGDEISRLARVCDALKSLETLTPAKPGERYPSDPATLESARELFEDVLTLELTASPTSRP